MRKLSNEQIESIPGLYEKGISASEVGRNLGVKGSTIIHHLKKAGIERRPSFHYKHTLNENYFDNDPEDWTWEQGYWFGFLCADGTNHCKKTEYNVQLALQARDKNHLEKFREAFNSSAPIKSYKIKNSEMCKTHLYSKHVCLRLSELGCVPRKSKILKFPSFLLDESLRGFILGYYDGDGSLGFADSQMIIYIAGTENICNNIWLILKNLVGIGGGVYRETYNRCSLFQAGGNKQVSKILNWLYADATIFLERKHKRYKEIMEILGR